MSVAASATKAVPASHAGDDVAGVVHVEGDPRETDEDRQGHADEDGDDHAEPARQAAPPHDHSEKAVGRGAGQGMARREAEAGRDHERRARRSWPCHQVLDDVREEAGRDQGCRDDQGQARAASEDREQHETDPDHDERLPRRPESMPPRTPSAPGVPGSRRRMPRRTQGFRLAQRARRRRRS